MRCTCRNNHHPSNIM